MNPFTINLEGQSESSSIALSPDGQHLVYEPNGQLYLGAMNETDGESPFRERGPVAPFLFSRRRTRYLLCRRPTPNGRDSGRVTHGCCRPRVGRKLRLLGIGRANLFWWETCRSIEFRKTAVLRRFLRGRATTVMWTTRPFCPEENGCCSALRRAVVARKTTRSWHDPYPQVNASLSCKARRNATYVRTGHLVYFQDYRLWGVGFDLDRVERISVQAGSGDYGSTDSVAVWVSCQPARGRRPSGGLSRT